LQNARRAKRRLDAVAQREAAKRSIEVLESTLGKKRSSDVVLLVKVPAR
jgi:hypothetical protein